MNRNEIVNPNSVQSQFAVLVRNKESLQKETISAENERRLEESKLQNLRSMQSTLSEKIRIAHANLGLEAKKKQMLNKEASRLKKVLKDDRVAIENLTDKVKSVEGDIIETKFQFVKEMDGLNEELADALRMYEERALLKALKRLVCCQTVKKYLLEKLQQSSLATDQCWENRYHSISSAVSTFENNMKQLERQKEYFRGLDGKVKEMRKQVESKHSKSLGQMELDELESLWEENQQEEMQSDPKVVGDKSSSMTPDPVNMQLFYGNSMHVAHEHGGVSIGHDNHEMVQVAEGTS